jgi:hypothetical protein
VNAPLTPDELEQRLRLVGEERYHDKHPFHRLMNAGKLSKGQLQAWALNRYYYQATIPLKDAVILSRMESLELRRAWRQRILDHDGDGKDEGGIRRWLALTDGLGLDKAYVVSARGILPITRFAVDAYVRFVRERSLLEAIARPAYVVPETKDLAALLADFRREKQHMAIVVDEYGSVDGIVTLEDVLEEIVGEIEDEFDLPDTSIERIDDRRVRIDGSYPIDDFNEAFGTTLEQDGFHTMAGLVFGTLGRAPEVQDSVVVDGTRLTVLEVEGSRILRLEVELGVEGETSSGAPEAA